MAILLCASSPPATEHREDTSPSTNPATQQGMLAVMLL